MPAHEESALISATVEALASIQEIDEVVVIDDGSTDETAVRASRAGARVLRLPRDVGKGRALEMALEKLPRAGCWVFADGDLGESASGLKVVLAEVLGGRADMAVAVLPPQGGGFGLVKRFAGYAIYRLCGLRTRAPLSGQRALSADALAACRPLASGFGLETGMTIDAVRAGFRLAEVDAPLAHEPTRRNFRGFVHRARQGMDIFLAVAVRLIDR